MVIRRAGYPEVPKGAKVIAFLTDHVMRVQLPLPSHVMHGLAPLRTLLLPSRTIDKTQPTFVFN